jgi:hypothetical protein
MASKRSSFNTFHWYSEFCDIFMISRSDFIYLIKISSKISQLCNTCFSSPIGSVVGDLIQGKGAASGPGHEASGVLGGSGETPLAVAEEQALK